MHRLRTAIVNGEAGELIKSMKPGEVIVYFLYSVLVICRISSVIYTTRRPDAIIVDLQSELKSDATFNSINIMQNTTYLCPLNNCSLCC